MTVTYTDLSHDELALFVALMKVMVHADENVTLEELKHFHRVGEEVGQERFLAAMQDSESRYDSTASVLAGAALVTDAAKQSFVHIELLAVAESDELDISEVALLDDLAKRWGL